MGAWAGAGGPGRSRRPFPRGMPGFFPIGGAVSDNIAKLFLAFCGRQGAGNEVRAERARVLPGSRQSGPCVACAAGWCLFRCLRGGTLSGTGRFKAVVRRLRLGFEPGMRDGFDLCRFLKSVPGSGGACRPGSWPVESDAGVPAGAGSAGFSP